MPPGVDLNRLMVRMTDAVRDLGDDLAAGPGRTPGGQYLENDTRELQTSLANWYASAQGSNDPYQFRRSYSGIDVAWHRLQGQINVRGSTTPPSPRRSAASA